MTFLFTPHTTKQDYFRRLTMPFKRPAALKVCPFAPHTGWTLNDIAPADVVLSTDTTEHPGVNSASLKVAVPVIASDATAKVWRIYKDFVTPCDVTDCTITIRYYCDAKWRPYGDTHYRANFHLLLSSSTDPITNKLQATIPISPGWHTVSITEPWCTTSGTVDIAAIRCVGIYYAANATNGNDEAYNVWFDSVTFTKSDRTKGGFILGFDDAYVSALTAAKMMAAEGYRSMVFAEPNTWGTSGRLTPDQLRECEKYGMLVCGHWQGVYYNGSNPEIVASDGAVHAWCRAIKRAFWQEGLRNGAEFVALPGGTAYQQSEEHIDIIRQYFTIIRGTGPLRTQGREPFKLTKHPLGAAVNKGGGLVGIPCAGHGFSAGTTIAIDGATGYTDAQYTAHATTSVNEVVITETFAAWAFTGVERIYPVLTNAISPQGHLSRAIHGANPLEPWWRWAVTPTAALDADYATSVNLYVDDAIAAKGIFELYDHDFGTSNLNAVRLAALIAYIKTKVDAGTLEVLTYEDLL